MTLAVIEVAARSGMPVTHYQSPVLIRDSGGCIALAKRRDWKALVQTPIYATKALCLVNGPQLTHLYSTAVIALKLRCLRHVRDIVLRSEVGKALNWINYGSNQFV